MLKTLTLDHQDYIHDVSFDHHGKRIATCSSDQTIVIYDKDPETGQWVKKDKIAENQESSDFNHKAPINRIKWCDPEFGSVLASCSNDKSFKIWAEEPYYSEKDQEVKYKFNYKTTNTLREAISDIDFAPKHFQNLVIAVAVTNGTISIYE